MVDVCEATEEADVDFDRSPSLEVGKSEVAKNSAGLDVQILVHSRRGEGRRHMFPRVLLASNEGRGKGHRAGVELPERLEDAVDCEAGVGGELRKVDVKVRGDVAK